jgi:hypothetical protein
MLGLDTADWNEGQAPIEGLPLLGIGIGQSPTGDGAQLLLRLPGQFLAFDVDRSEMARFANQLSEIAHMLGATARA